MLVWRWPLPRDRGTVGGPGHGLGEQPPSDHPLPGHSNQHGCCGTPAFCTYESPLYLLCWSSKGILSPYLMSLYFFCNKAKRVVSYLGRARPERLVDELMNELQTVETLNMTIERTQTPPYFRLSQTKRYPVTVNTTDDEKLETQPGDVPLEKGTLHTKRHSTNEEIPSDR